MISNDWVLFASSAITIMIAGIAVAWLGDAIAKRTRLGGLWIGLILIAFVTSLPEIATAVSAGRIGVPDLSAGDLFGSGLINLAVMAIADLLHRRRRLLKSVTLGHVVSGGLAVILTAIASIFIILKTGLSLGWFSYGSVTLFITYLFGIRLVSRHEEKLVGRELEKQVEQIESEVSKKLEELPWWILAFAVSLAALIILLAAPWLTASGSRLATATGLGASFFGTLFIAFTTSLPELVVSIAAIRLAAFDLVVGNIFGSNAFNMAAIIVLDLFYVNGSVFSALSPVHAVTGLFIVIITMVAIMGLVFRSEKRYLFFEPDAGLILVLVVLAMYAVWQLG
jgi:cation:H+ antiporter